MEKIFYLAQVFGTLSTLCSIFLLLSCIGLGGSIIIYFLSVHDRNKYGDNFDEDVKISSKIIKWSIPLVVLFTLGSIFIPSKSTYLFMVGGKVVDNAVEKNQELEELPTNTLNLLNEYIKIKTEELDDK